jgi:phosphate transport system permease protein
MLTNIIRACIRNLSGIPSIIYGLFGLALFVQAMRLGTSVLSAGLTLGLLSLPYIITTTEEALKRIPNSMREATLALGATQFETIKDVVLPKALPGILTGVILTLSRAAGETAPILFTGVAFYINGLTTSFNQEFMALPYHLYMLSTQHQSIEQVRPLAYGTAVVLILLVFLLNSIAFYIRFKQRTQD